MNFENPKTPEESDEKEKKFNLEELYEKFPGIGEHDVTMSKEKDEIILTGRGVKGSLKAGEEVRRKVPKEFRKDRERTSLDKLSKEEQEKIAWDWFNIAPDFIKVLGMNFKPYNAWRRRMEKPYGLQWGFGLIQFSGRHLIYFGKQDKHTLYLLFIKIF